MKFQPLIPNRPLWLSAAFFVILLSTLVGARFAGLFPALVTSPENVETSYSYFIDNTNSHVFSYVRESASFRTIEDPKDIPWSLGEKSYWVQLEIQNLESEYRHLALYFDTPMIDRLNIYQYDESGREVKRWRLGDSLERGYLVGDMPPAIHFAMEGFERSYIYLHVYSKGIPVMPIWVMDKHDFHTLTQLLHAIWGGFTAIMLTVAAYTFAVYAMLRERVYIVYTLYVLVSMVQLGAVHGFGIYLFPAPIQVFFSNNTVGLTFGLFLLSLLYAYLYLRSHKVKSLLRQVVNYAMMVLLGLMLISFVTPEYIAATFLIAIQPVFYLLIGILVWKRWTMAQKWSPMFTFSWIPLVISGIFPPLLITGTIEYSLASRYAFMLGNVTAVMFMALALAERFRQQREQSVYQMTHDTVSATPNVNVLSLVMDNLIDRNRAFTLCCFQIDRFNSLAPYMSSQQKKVFIGEVCDRLHHSLDCDTVQVLESGDDRTHRIACINDGLFGFVVLSTEKAKIKLLLASVLDEVDNDVELSDLSIRTQGTIGSSEFPKDGNQHDTLLRKAMQAVAETSPIEKRLNTYDSLNSFNRTLNMSLVSDLKKAIERDELELYHQPQVDLRTGSIHGSEVLLRWDHPKYGQVSPEVFVKLAEEVGLINDLTLWVIKRAFYQQSKLIELGFSRRLSINVSASDIVIPNLVDRIADIAQKYHVPTGTLSLELTESTMVSDYDSLHEVIDRLSEYDIEVSIDDYGTGYSSLTYLSQLPFTELKIDRSFIKTLTNSPRKQNIVRATTEMAKSLGLMVVAEGVEDLETASVLKRYGVDIAQGYHYSRPLSFSQYLLYLKRTAHQVPVVLKRSNRFGAQSG
ncbi:signal protein [Grimontia hollisae]|uniref:EAL family protein n=1 Tax=Grimontia hollisae CIP 101886 TaxID=675812 RepID=D0I625_GRIHO|nr:EAL domain-containing protein [Grimontia hollisae]AMG29073.1 signal protein [Grimontia hollisae]EEY73339.1 EAL family protein [Grimontia hollisae CIP 101886]MDF2183450.1 EAL domain-containing protein [Grimontia hollisae]STO76949.1 Bacteriophytochrome cph2 [Grimontia hollisae]